VNTCGLPLGVTYFLEPVTHFYRIKSQEFPDADAGQTVAQKQINIALSAAQKRAMSVTLNSGSS